VRVGLHGFGFGRLQGLDQQAGADAAGGRQKQAQVVGQSGGRDGDYAAGLLAALAKWRIFIRKPMAPGLNHCIRISVGTSGELDALAAALPRAMAGLD
jgi:hypothetical protein